MLISVLLNAAVLKIVSAQLSVDINEDGVIDIIDLTIVALAFNSKEGEETYNPIADLDGNKEIDIADLTLVAVDFEKEIYSLTINVSGQGTTYPDFGIHKYVAGTQVNITAIADLGWRFSHWNDDAAGSENPLTVFMGSNRNVSAYFAEMFDATYRLYGLDFGPHIEEGEDPSTIISEEQLRQRMEIIAPYTEWIRTYSCNNGLENAGFIAHELGLKVAVGAWLGTDLSANEREISTLISIAQAGEADVLIVGSEVLLRNDLTGDQLVAYINRVREAVPTIPVATADTYGKLLQHPAVINACDVVLPNYYPFWEGININYAMYYLNLQHQQVVEAANCRPVIISETGWPSGGNQVGDAIPSPENARLFFMNFISWAKAENVSYLYFEAMDEPWKANTPEGPQGAHWGIFFGNGTLKPGMQDVFDGETMPDNWSSQEIVGGEGNPVIEFTYVPPLGSFENLRGQVWHVRPVENRVAVYIYVTNGWWNKPSWDYPSTITMPDGSWFSDITTGGVDEEATKIVAFLIPSAYSPPLMNGNSTLPQELEEECLAKVEVTRPE